MQVGERRGHSGRRSRLARSPPAAEGELQVAPNTVEILVKEALLAESLLLRRRGASRC